LRLLRRRSIKHFDLYLLVILKSGSVGVLATAGW
jgi:hypothetical protein